MNYVEEVERYTLSIGKNGIILEDIHPTRSGLEFYLEDNLFYIF